MAEKSDNELPRDSVDNFILKLYEESWLQARHIDEYMDRVPRFFLIIVGAITTIIAAAIQFSEINDSVVKVLGIGLLILAFIGLFASLTIPRYRTIRNEYFNAVYAIHKYYSDKIENLKDYIGLQIGGIFEGYLNPIRVDFFRFLIMVLLDTSLFGAGLYAIQQSEPLVNRDFSIIPSCSWIIVVIFFFTLHISLYFLIVRYYKPKT